MIFVYRCGILVHGCWGTLKTWLVFGVGHGDLIQYSDIGVCKSGVWLEEQTEKGINDW